MSEVKAKWKKSKPRRCSNKALISFIHENTDLSRRQVRDSLYAFQRFTLEKLGAGESVYMHGVGHLWVATRPARKLAKPRLQRTFGGKEFMQTEIPEHKLVFFKPGKLLRAAMRRFDKPKA